MLESEIPLESDWRHVEVKIY